MKNFKGLLVVKNLYNFLRGRRCPEKIRGNKLFFVDNQRPNLLIGQKSQQAS